jgi:hypothetical protein
MLGAHDVKSKDTVYLYELNVEHWYNQYSLYCTTTHSRKMYLVQNTIHLFAKEKKCLRNNIISKVHTTQPFQNESAHMSTLL